MIVKFLLVGTLLSGFLFAAEVGSGNPAADSSSVVAEVNGAKITLGDFEQKRPGVVFQARNTYYETLRKAMDDYLTEFLLEQQAQKENLTVAQLLEKHVNSTLPTAVPSEEALHLYYEGTNSKEPYEKVRVLILDHIRDTRLANAKAAYLDSLRTQAKVVYRLSPPRNYISTKNAPVRGNADAKVTIVEFADYECPYCQQMQPTLDKIEAEYQGKIAFAYKDLPLPMHPHAQKAAEAAQCAGAQGKYWEYHDALFKSKQLEVAQLKETAAALKLDTKAFDACLDSGKEQDIVKANKDEALSLQISGTPSFFVNGRFLSGGLNYDEFKKLLDDELSNPAEPQRASR